MSGKPHGDPVPGTRFCPHCGTVQPAEAFPGSPDGEVARASWCQTCRVGAKGVAPSLARKFRQMQLDARRRNLVFSLTWDFFLRLSRDACCTYCGASDPVGGIDRLDSRHGYVLGNVVPCCAVCNRMKGTMEVARFAEQCRRIASTISDNTLIALVAAPVVMCGKHARHAPGFPRTVEELSRPTSTYPVTDEN